MERACWRISLPRSYRVVDTTEAVTLRAIGAHGGSFAGPYQTCQTWALALRNHPLGIDGVLYESVRHKRGLCLALFAERTEKDSWEAGVTGTALVQHPDLVELLEQNGITQVQG